MTKLILIKQREFGMLLNYVNVPIHVLLPPNTNLTRKGEIRITGKFAQTSPCKSHVGMSIAAGPAIVCMYDDRKGGSCNVVMTKLVS